MEKIFAKTIVKNGIKLQSVIAMEECSELTKEISKFIRGKGIKDNLVEEMADVLIVIEQLKMMYAISPQELGEMVDKKVNRLKERLEECL